jgi:hypothetical protein
MPTRVRSATPSEAARALVVVLPGVLPGPGVVPGVVVSGRDGATEPAGLLDQRFDAIDRARVEHEDPVAAALANHADLTSRGVGEQDLLGPGRADWLRGDGGRRVRGAADGHRDGRRGDHAQHASVIALSPSGELISWPTTPLRSSS